MILDYKLATNDLNKIENIKIENKKELIKMYIVMFSVGIIVGYLLTKVMIEIYLQFHIFFYHDLLFSILATLSIAFIVALVNIIGTVMMLEAYEIETNNKLEVNLKNIFYCDIIKPIYIAVIVFIIFALKIF